MAYSIRLAPWGTLKDMAEPDLSSKVDPPSVET